MHPHPRPRRPGPRYDTTSTSSLVGLERAIPPSHGSPAASAISTLTISTSSSKSNINKPLPPSPLYARRPTSSLYSRTQDEIIESYLSRNLGRNFSLQDDLLPPRVFEAPRASRSLQSLTAVEGKPAVREIYGSPSAFAASESMLPTRLEETPCPKTPKVVKLTGAPFVSSPLASPQTSPPVSPPILTPWPATSPRKSHGERLSGDRSQNLAAHYQIGLPSRPSTPFHHDPVRADETVSHRSSFATDISPVPSPLRTPSPLHTPSHSPSHPLSSPSTRDPCTPLTPFRQSSPQSISPVSTLFTPSPTKPHPNAPFTQAQDRLRTHTRNISIPAAEYSQYVSDPDTPITDGSGLSPLSPPSRDASIRSRLGGLYDPDPPPSSPGYLMPSLMSFNSTKTSLPKEIRSPAVPLTPNQHMGPKAWELEKEARPNASPEFKHEQLPIPSFFDSTPVPPVPSQKFSSPSLRKKRSSGRLSFLTNRKRRSRDKEEKAREELKKKIVFVGQTDPMAIAAEFEAEIEEVRRLAMGETSPKKKGRPWI